MAKTQKTEYDQIKYRITMRAKYKRFYLVLGILLIAVAALIGILSFPRFHTLEKPITYIVFCTFFPLCGLWEILETRKQLIVYRGGRVRYCNRFGWREFWISDLYTANPRSQGGADAPMEDYGVHCSYYDVNGRKAFFFGMAYDLDALAQLKREVEQCHPPVPEEKRPSRRERRKKRAEE